MDFSPPIKSHYHKSRQQELTRLTKAWGAIESEVMDLTSRLWLDTNCCHDLCFCLLLGLYIMYHIHIIMYTIMYNYIYIYVYTYIYIYVMYIYIYIIIYIYVYTCVYMCVCIYDTWESLPVHLDSVKFVLWNHQSLNDEELSSLMQSDDHKWRRNALENHFIRTSSTWHLYLA